jgi:hypothetical protein
MLEGRRVAAQSAARRRPRRGLARKGAANYSLIMSTMPSGKAKRGASKTPVFVPHPDDEADVRAGLEEVARGDLLSAEESAAYLRSLLGDSQPPRK